MDLSAQFNKKSISKDKLGREIKTSEDFRTARISHGDGSSALYRGGLMVPGSYSGSKHVAKEDAPSDKTKFLPTPVVTIVQEPEKEKVCSVRKNFDVNAQAMKL